MSSPRPGPSGLNKRVQPSVASPTVSDTPAPAYSFISSPAQTVFMDLDSPTIWINYGQGNTTPVHTMNDAMKRFIRVSCSSDYQKSDDNMGVSISVDNQQVTAKNRMQSDKKDRAREHSAIENVARGDDIFKSSIQMDLGDTQGYSVKEWVSRMASKVEIILRHLWNALTTSSLLPERFTRFLHTHTEKDKKVYMKRIQNMCGLNESSFIIEYPTLLEAEPAIASFVIEAPQEMLQILDEVASYVTLELNPGYKRLASKGCVKINKIPITSEIDLTSTHLGKLVRFLGVVTSMTGIYASLSFVQFECRRCNNAIGPYLIYETSGTKDEACGICRDPGPLYAIEIKNIYKKYQRIEIEECPGSHLKGRPKPRKQACILLDELCGSCKPGNEVDITGIYTTNYDSSISRDRAAPKFETVVVVNHLVVKSGEELGDLITPDEIAEIINISRYKHCGEIIANSIMPSLPGYAPVKRVIAMALFGGVCIKGDSDVENNTRGDIHVLFYGDPKIAKSQILKYVEEMVPRCVYIKGKDSVIGDLTASVRTTPDNSDWTLEAGASVLADQGFCLIDGLDETTGEVQRSIDASINDMQAVVVSTRHVVTTLHSRCSVLATTNLTEGEYRPQLGLYRNVKLSKKILARYDILCLVHDEGQTSDLYDELSSESAYSLQHEPSSALPSDSNAGFILPQEMLKKYILYARRMVHPKIESAVKESMNNFIQELKYVAANVGATPITVRHMQSLRRLSEAHARMHLREVVTTADMVKAAHLLLHNYIKSQDSRIGWALRKVAKTILE